MRSWRYLANSTVKQCLRRGQHCPSCGCAQSSVVDRKWIVTALRRCADCSLLFRAPTTTKEENQHLYQQDYQEGFTTQLPSDRELAAHLEAGFAGHERDYTAYLDVLQALAIPPAARLLDFGCSWGYGSHQLSQAGYTVDACEISRPRADFARDKLGVNVRELTALSERTYDVFFSAHVIEHVPSVREMIDLGLRLLRPNGFLVAFTPNQSDARRARVPQLWHRQWGFVHPQLLDEQFLRQLPQPSVFGGTSPFALDQIRTWKGVGKQMGAMDGDELLLVIRKEAS